jgi:dihydroorotate dehydrogenase (fumarate)
MNLSTKYLGMVLRTPLVPSASPLSNGLDNVRRMEDAGAAAIVFHSLFEEQVVQEQNELHQHLTHGTDSYAEALTYAPDLDELTVGPETYLVLRMSSKWLWQGQMWRCFAPCCCGVGSTTSK